MVDGSHRGFNHSKIIARLTDKHLVDISCPGSSWPSLSEKPPPHTHFCERDFRPDPALQEFTDHMNSIDEDIKWTTEREVTSHTQNEEEVNIDTRTERALAFFDT